MMTPAPPLGGPDGHHERLAVTEATVHHHHGVLNDLLSRMTRLERAVWAFGGGVTLLNVLRACH